MSCQDKVSRIIVKRSFTAGVAPTVPPNEDHRSGLWSDTDIYIGEMFFNVVDGKLYTRSNAGIEEVATKTGTFNNIVFVGSKSDFPAPVANVITLVADVTYFITDHIDLTGARLVGAENTTIIGGSSENCTITSTGLDGGTALFTTEWTTPIRHISFKDVGTALRQLTVLCE
jgi:hypothetical protein